MRGWLRRAVAAELRGVEAPRLVSRAISGEPCCGPAISRGGLASSVTRSVRHEHDASTHRPFPPALPTPVCETGNGPAVSCHGARDAVGGLAAERGCGSWWKVLRCRHGYRSHRPGARGDAVAADTDRAAADDGGGLPRLTAGPKAAGGARRTARRDSNTGTPSPRRPGSAIRSARTKEVLHMARPRWPIASARSERGAGEVLRQHRPHPSAKLPSSCASTCRTDQSVFLHPARTRMPRPVLTIGEQDFPDVVLEVDHATDVRRRKVPKYEGVGVPGILDRGAGGRCAEPSAEPAVGADHPPAAGWGVPGMRRASRAFPGWTAVEIHAALNEDAFSARTSAVLKRVGAVLGEQQKAPARTTTQARCWALSAAGAERRVMRSAMRQAGRHWRGRCWRRAASRCRLDSLACRLSPSCPTTSSRKPPPPASARPTFGSVCATGSRPPRRCYRPRHLTSLPGWVTSYRAGNCGRLKRHGRIARYRG